MTISNNTFCVITPLANEAEGLSLLVDKLKYSLDELGRGNVCFIVDKASTDNTLELCKQIANEDNRFKVIWAPENKNVVDAYMRGYKEVCNDYNYIIEMDAGLSHDPLVLSQFVNKLEEGYDIVYGSRFMKGGKISNAPYSRLVLSKGGTILSGVLLGLNMYDMTSGYIGMKRGVAQRFANYQLLSKGHFYQTEMRYLLRNYNSIEIPIHYQSPSKRVSSNSIKNSFSVLFYYFKQRFTGKSISI
ncbi:MAG: glycosyltransferase [Bacteroidota bacterium]